MKNKKMNYMKAVFFVFWSVSASAESPFVTTAISGKDLVKMAQEVATLKTAKELRGSVDAGERAIKNNKDRPGFYTIGRDQIPETLSGAIKSGQKVFGSTNFKEQLFELLVKKAITSDQYAETLKHLDSLAAILTTLKRKGVNFPPMDAKALEAATEEALAILTKVAIDHGGKLPAGFRPGSVSLGVGATGLVTVGTGFAAEPKTPSSLATMMADATSGVGGIPDDRNAEINEINRMISGCSNDSAACIQMAQRFTDEPVKTERDAVVVLQARINYLHTLSGTVIRQGEGVGVLINPNLETKSSDSYDF